MAYVVGVGSTIYDIVENMDTLLQSVGWVREEIETTMWNNQSRTSYCFWKGTGDGNDRIYLQVRVPTVRDADINSKAVPQGQTMLLDSSCGYDMNLEYFEQPGSIQQWLKSYGYSDAGVSVNVNQPIFTVTADERFAYWIFADTYHVVVVARMSIVYESMYMGFLNPISSERQYPYPMYICGNGAYNGGDWNSNQTGSFVFPKNNQGFLRRADGVWRAFNADVPNPDPYSEGTVFPYNAHNQYLIPNYHRSDVIEQDNFLLIPVMLQTHNPTDMNGLLRDVFWISGTRDVSAEQILVYQDSQYIVFDTKQYRGANTYFAVKME